MPNFNANYNPRFSSNGSRFPNRLPNPNYQPQPNQNVRHPAHAPNGRNGHNQPRQHVPHRPQQQYGPHPYQAPANYANYNDDHMQQGSSTGRRSRRRDIFEIRLSGASKRGHGQGQKGDNGQNKKLKDRNNFHFGPNFGSKSSGGKGTSAKLADTVATSVVSTLCNGLELDQDTGKLVMKNKKAIIDYADLYIGNYRGILNTSEHVLKDPPIFRVKR